MKKRARRSSPLESPDQQTRLLILKAASALFAEIGFEATSTKVIAARAGVPSGSIFYHFGNKQALIDAIFSETVVDGIRAAFDAIKPNADPVKGLVSAATALYTWLGEHEDQARIMFREITSHRPIAKRLVTIRRAAIAQLARRIEFYVDSGDLQPMNCRVAAQALGSSLLFAAVVDQPANPRAYIKDLISLMFRQH